MEDEVSYESQLCFLEHDLGIVIPAYGIIESRVPVFRTGSYELIHSCVGGVVFLYYQDSRYLMRLVEAVEEECPLGCGQMFQH